MTDIWDEKPESKAKHRELDRDEWEVDYEYYLKTQMDAWLEKMQSEWNAILRHHVTQEEGQEKQINDLQDKLEAIESIRREGLEKWKVDGDYCWLKISEILGAEDLQSIGETPT